MFIIILEVLVCTIRQEKGNKNKKRIRNVCTLTVVYIENLKLSTKRILELINEFSKDVG